MEIIQTINSQSTSSKEKILNLENKVIELHNDAKRYKNYANKLNKHLRDNTRLNKVNVGTNTPNTNILFETNKIEKETDLEILKETNVKFLNERTLRPAFNYFFDKFFEASLVSDCDKSCNYKEVKENIFSKFDCIEKKILQLESENERLKNNLEDKLIKKYTKMDINKEAEYIETVTSQTMSASIVVISDAE